MADEVFRYIQHSGPTQALLAGIVRDASHTLEVNVPRSGITSIVMQFDDVPDVPNQVTPIFRAADGVTLLFEPVPVAAPNVTQLYLVGHGKVVPDGIIGKITGQTEGPGMGVVVDYDLDITAFDQLKAMGLAGHTPFFLPKFEIEFQHDGAAPVTYGALITVEV